MLIYIFYLASYAMSESTENDEDVCFVCMTGEDEGAIYVSDICCGNLYYHEPCIDTLLKRDNTACPICKKKTIGNKFTIKTTRKINTKYILTSTLSCIILITYAVAMYHYKLYVDRYGKQDHIITLCPIPLIVYMVSILTSYTTSINNLRLMPESERPHILQAGTVDEYYFDNYALNKYYLDCNNSYCIAYTKSKRNSQIISNTLYLCIPFITTMCINISIIIGYHTNLKLELLHLIVLYSFIAFLVSIMLMTIIIPIMRALKAFFGVSCPPCWEYVIKFCSARIYTKTNVYTIKDQQLANNV